jgi:predicted nucleotidyltransferase component of viral defense system
MTEAQYEAQVELLVRVLPEVAEEEDFALKGGTAINLFIRNLPRFSVDIDLVYLPIADRNTSLAAVRSGLGRTADRIRKRVKADVDENVSKDGTRIVVRSGATMVKIETSPVLRGTVFEPELRPVSARVEDRFGYAEMKLVSLPDLYAGKIAAALDRQHPRDLFDVRDLLANEGITEEIFRAFLVYLVSHNRPPEELLDPNRLDIEALFHGEFAGMTVEPVALADLIDTREALFADIAGRAGQAPARDFLRSFFALKPDWSLLGLATDISTLPAVRWKMTNLSELAQHHAAKFEAQQHRLDLALRR